MSIQLAHLARFPFDDKPIKAIVTPAYSTFVITEEGQVYSCGKNPNRILGYATSANQTTFRQVPLPVGIKIKQLIVADDTVLALSTNNKVFGWGNGKSGLLGSEHMHETHVAPQQLSLGHMPIVAMYCDIDCSGAVFVTTNNKALILSNNPHNPLLQHAAKELATLFALYDKNKGIIRNAYTNTDFFFAANKDTPLCKASAPEESLEHRPPHP